MARNTSQRSTGNGAKPLAPTPILTDSDLNALAKKMGAARVLPVTSKARKPLPTKANPAFIGDGENIMLWFEDGLLHFVVNASEENRAAAPFGEKDGKPTKTKTLARAQQGFNGGVDIGDGLRARIWIGESV